MRGVVRLTTLGFRSGQRAPLALMLLVVALASAGIAASATVSRDAAKRVDASFAAANGPDAVVTVAAGDGAPVFEALATDPDVSDAASPRAATEATMVLDETHSIQHVIAVPGADDAVGHPVLHTGRFPEATNEITLDAAVASTEHVEIGDVVVFAPDGGGLEVSMLVVGTAYDFADCFFPTCDPARSWVTDTGLERLGGATMEVIGVQVVASDRAGGLQERLEVVTVGADIGVNTWADTRGDMLAISEFFAAFLGVFGGFVLAASLVVIAAALVARSIGRQRRTGLYRALGATPGQVAAAMVFEHLAIAVAGATLGWAVASLLAPSFLLGPLSVLGAGAPRFDVGLLALCLAISSVVVSLATVVPARRAAHVAAVDAMRGSTVVSRGRSRVIDRIALRLAPPVELGVRRWRARPFRTATTITALAIATVAGVVSISIHAATDRLLAEPALLGDPWSALYVPLGTDDAGAIEAVLADSPEVTSWFTMVDTSATIDGERLHVRLLGGDADAAQFALGAGRSPRQDSEAIAGYGLFESNGWQLGEDIEVTVDERSESVRIVGWYRESEDSGELLQIRAADAAQDESAIYAINTHKGGDPVTLVRSLGALGGRLVPNEPDGSGMAPFRLAMAIMTGLIVAVALAHLAATALGSARERARDTDALRAVGCTSAQIVGSAATSAALSGICALLVGLPLGWALQRVLSDAITAGVGVGPGAGGSPPIVVVALAAACLLVLGVVVESWFTATTGRRGRLPSV